MTPRLVVAAAGSLLSLSLIASPSASAGTSVALDVAKSRSSATAFGRVTPAHPGERVRVRFFQDIGSGFQRLGTKFDVLSSRGRFNVSFARPTQGTCRFVVVYVGGQRPSDHEDFSCSVPEFGTGSATITTDSQPVTIDLLLAETGEQQGYGLMYRRSLAIDKGMAFIFQADTEAGFFMQNTLIPLSIAFFDSTGQILEIMDMDPCADGAQCPTFSPGVPYRGALEVNQGAFGTWGVGKGDIIQYTRD